MNTHSVVVAQLGIQLGIPTHAFGALQGLVVDAGVLGSQLERQAAGQLAALLQRAETGVLTIGFVSTAKYFLMRLLAEFCTLHLGVDIQISIGNRDQLVGMLQNSEVDISVLGRAPIKLQTRAEPFGAHPHVLVSAVDHPLAHRGHLRMEDLRPFDLIVREKGAGARAAMDKFFEDTYVEPRMKIELHSNEIIKQAVMAGLGLGFLWVHTIGLELEHKLIRMLDVEGAPVVRSWNVVHPQSKMLSPAAEAFRYFMLEEAESHLAQRFGMHWPKA